MEREYGILLQKIGKKLNCQIYTVGICYQLTFQFTIALIKQYSIIIIVT